MTNIARVWLVAALLAACRRASTPAPQLVATAVPHTLPTMAESGQRAETPAGETFDLPPPATPSPTGLAYAVAAGTRSPTHTLTPTITPDHLACLPPGEPDEVAQVQWVANGDTIVVELQGRPKSVRYLGIDAPAYLPNSRFIGPLAYQHNRRLVEGQIVSLYRDGTDSDEKGQLLRYVVTHGVFVNLELVRLGLASPSATAGAGSGCAASLRQAEQAAQAARVGLWSREVGATTVVTGQATAPPPATPTLTLAAGLTAASPLTRTPTLGTPSATATQGTDAGVHITDVQYNGTVSDQEKDEYVEITNESSVPVTITGWRLVSKNTSITFTFPTFTLPAGVFCFVYTNQVDEDSCVNDSSRQAVGIWALAGDCAQIYDARSVMQHQFCY